MHDPLDRRRRCGDASEHRILLDHSARGVEDDAGLLAVRGRGDHLATRLLLRTEAVEQTERGGQRRLAGAARHHHEHRADLAAAEFVGRAVNLADQPLLPVGKGEWLTGEAALVQAQLTDEADGQMGPAERVRDRIVRPEPCGAGAVKLGHALISRATCLETRRKAGPREGHH
jgi:hypothetical protein